MDSKLCSEHIYFGTLPPNAKGSNAKSLKAIMGTMIQLWWQCPKIRHVQNKVLNIIFNHFPTVSRTYTLADWHKTLRALAGERMPSARRATHDHWHERQNGDPCV